MNKGTFLSLVGGLLIVMLVTGCGRSSTQTNLQSNTSNRAQATSPGSITTPTLTSTAGPSGNLVPAQTRPGSSVTSVFLILMENHNWADIAGSAAAPYINNTLLPMASYARAYYNPPGMHPSEPNYIWLEAGTNLGVTDDALPASNHQSTTMHLVTLLNHAHISWKAYQENISGTDCPLVGNNLYAPRHNPMIFFDDVTDTNNPQSAYCIAHERPASELSADLQQNSVARYNFITPNVCNDMHDTCAPLHNSIEQGDTWLSHEIPMITASRAYKSGGIIFITWDEGETGDGPIGMIALSPYAKGHGYSNTIHYTHSSTLRTLEELFHVSPLLGDAARASDLSDLFRRLPA